MNTKFQIAANLSLPIEMATDTIGIVAVKGAGKTFTFLVLVEEMIASGVPVVVFDPVGVCHGLRSSADGKSVGLQVIVLGGSHGDLPLDPHSGRVLAEFAASERRSIVLDFSNFDTKADQIRFSQAFLTRLYEVNREPLHVVLDEADEVAPQKPFGEETRLLRAAEILVRRGRARGIGVTMVTQRPAVLNKNLITQCGTLIIGRVTSPQDRKAIEAWVDANGTQEQKAAIFKSLASLPTADKWVWSPLAGIFERVTIRKRTTFDSSATPKLGAIRVQPSKLAPVDLEALRAKIATAAEKVKLDDPKLLRARIAELERGLKAAVAGHVPPVMTPKRVEVPVPVSILTAADYTELRSLLGELESMHAAIGTAVDTVGKQLDEIRARFPLTLPPPKANGVSHPARQLRPTLSSYAAPAAVTLQETTSDNGRHVGEGERAALIAIAQHQDGVTRDQISILTGYKRSTRDAYVQRLSRDGLCAVDGDIIVATERGKKWLGADYEPLPTGKALRDYWLARLPEGEREIFHVIVSAHPRNVTRDEITQQLGQFARSTRDAYIQRLARRRIVVAGRSKQVRAAEALFS